MHSSIIVEHKREKESAIIMGVFSLVLACVNGYTFVLLSVCAGRESGSVVCLCVEGSGCSPDFSWELQWSMSSAEKQQEQATFKLNGHNLKTSTFTLASSSMSSRAVKHAINTHTVLGCQSEQEVQGIFRFIWILTFFRWIVIYCISVYDWFDSSVK